MNYITQDLRIAINLTIFTILILFFLWYSIRTPKKRLKKRGLSEPMQIIMVIVMLLFASVGFIIEYKINSNEVAAGYAFLFLTFALTTLAFFFYKVHEAFRR